MRPFELFVGLRYTRAKRRTQFVSFISMISMAGIALGIAALITVMSVMNGFEKEIRARILGAAAHIQILGGEEGIPDWEALAAAVTQEFLDTFGHGTLQRSQRRDPHQRDVG